MVLSQIHNKAREFKAHVPEMFRAMRETRQFMRNVDPVIYYLQWGTAVVRGIMSLGAFAATGIFFQQVSNGKLQEYLSPANMSVPLVAGIVTAIVLYQLARRIIEAVGQWRGRLYEDKIEFLLEQQDAELLTGLDAGRLSDPEFIMLKEAATKWQGRNSVRNLFSQQKNFIGAATGVIASIALIAVLDPFFILLALLPVVLKALKELMYDKKHRTLWEDLHLIRRMKDEYENCLTKLDRLLQGKLLRSTAYWQERYYALRIEVWQRTRDLNWWSAKNEFAISVVGVFMFAVVIAYLGNKLVSGTIAFSEIFFFWGSVQTLGNSLGRLSGSLIEIRKECLNYDYRQQYLAAKPCIDESNAEVFRFGSTPYVELQNVSFRYPRQERLALSGVSLVIHPGEKVAIIGQNGSGKTTILRLLSKIYLPDEGAVIIDGLPTPRIKQSCWFEQMLYATQETRLPEFTVEEALTGTYPKSADMQRLAQAAEHSRATQIIAEEFPNQYQQQLGADWPDGKEPSTGQWQRLKLTAAFYRLLEPQVRIGLFDEPMSQCDVETRERFYRDLQGIHGKTIVVVAHDPVYLHYFGRVILIENGRVKRDMRTHEEIAAYQREAIPQFEDAERKGGHLHAVE